MSLSRIVVIGASSGGIDALRQVVKGLPADFSAAVCVVVHTAPEAPGVMDSILNKHGVLFAANAEQGTLLEPGRIYVAPPDRHLLVEPGRLRLSRAPRENRFRPAIDPLFRSAAQVYGPAAIGVILSGNLDDGTSGLKTVKQMGGIAIVQDPADALYSSMPQSALNHVAVDYVRASADIAPLLATLVTTPVTQYERAEVPRSLEVEMKIANGEDPLESGLAEIGKPSAFSCPECHGVLLRLLEADPVRFRCHTGHAFSVGSLIASVNQSIEDSLWSSARALHEGLLLLGHLEEHTHDATGKAAVNAQIAATKTHFDAIRRVLDERTRLITDVGAAVRKV